jgi:hypothetical protein
LNLTKLVEKSTDFKKNDISIIRLILKFNFVIYLSYNVDTDNFLYKFSQT